MRLFKSLITRSWFAGLALTLVFLLMAEFGVFAGLDREAYKLGARVSAAREPHPDVIVVAIDDRSLETLGAWPWSRDVLAEAMQQIVRGSPRVVGFAMPLDTGQYHASQGTLAELRRILRAEKKLSRLVNRALTQTESTLLGDANLARVFRNARVVLSMEYRPASGSETGLTAALPENLRKFVLPGISASSPGVPDSIAAAAAVTPPLDILVDEVGGVGVDRYLEQFFSEPLIVRYGDDLLPSFPLMLATRGKGLSTRDIGIVPGAGPTLGRALLGADPAFRIYPRFYRAAAGQSPFPVVSLVDVLDGSVEPSAFIGKTVIVGLTSPRLARPRVSPAGDPVAPALASAHTVSSLLNNDLYRLPDWSDWARRGLILVIGLYLTLVLGRFRPNTAVFLSLFLMVMVLNAHFLLMSLQATWVPMMSVVVMILVGHVVVGWRRALNARFEQLQGALTAANRALGQSLQEKGNLDQAFEKLRACEVDEALLGQLYSLGLDFERKRQFNKAAAVFKYLRRHQPDYNDAAERIAQNERAAQSIVLGGGAASGPGATLIAGTDGIEKPKLGRYRIDSEIGRGAMGMVYLGHDEGIGRTVAIKTLSLTDDIDDEMRDEVRQRFFREAEAAGRLDHPNIVTIYDVGEEQELAYIAMDFLKGKDLSNYCRPDSLLPASQVFHVIGSIAMALDYAHQQHVVHRDIKPANIIYDADKQTARITDFGVACLTDASKTSTGTVLGTPYYMAPEQLAGKKVDGRADIYSLGVTLYQMLCGELPFKGESIANLIYNIANEKHPSIRQFRPDLPRCVTAVINKALHKEADSRFASGKQMAMMMHRCQQSIREIEAA